MTLVSFKSGFMKLSNSFTDKNGIPCKGKFISFKLLLFVSVWKKFSQIQYSDILSQRLELNFFNNFMSITDSPPLHKHDCLPISASEASLQLSRVILSKRIQSQLCVWLARPWTWCAFFLGLGLCCSRFSSVPICHCTLIQTWGEFSQSLVKETRHTEIYRCVIFFLFRIPWPNHFGLLLKIVLGDFSEHQVFS